MSATNIRAVKHRYQGEVVFVVGSGASVDQLSRAIFALGIVVAVNEMWQHVPADFVVAHHHEHLQAAIDAGPAVVTSETDWGMPGWGTPAAFTGDYYTYRTEQNTRTLTPTIDAHALAQDTLDSLVVSCCTTSEALQFAGHLGAAVIVCCGVDGAALDGQWCVQGYNADPATGRSAATNPQHVRLTQGILKATYAALRGKGIPVHALSPFVGADHEGHVYRPAPELAGRDLVKALSTVNWQEAAR